MLNVLGGVKVYDAKEIDSMMRTTHGFTIVNTLPPIQTANIGLVYYKTTAQAVTEIKGYRRIDDTDDTDDLTPEPDATHVIPVYISRPALIPYIIGVVNGHRVWYTVAGHPVDSSPISDEEILAIWHRYDEIG